MLNKYHINVVKEEMERVDTLRFQYGNLQSKAVSYFDTHTHTHTHIYKSTSWLIVSYIE